MWWGRALPCPRSRRPRRRSISSRTAPHWRGAARLLGVPVFHCTAETRDDGKGANQNAALFFGVRKMPVQLSPGSDAVRVPDLIGVDPGDIVLPRHHGLGPMTGTQLDSMLRNLNVTTIIGVGVSVNIGMTNFSAFDARISPRGDQLVTARTNSIALEAPRKALLDGVEPTRGADGGTSRSPRDIRRLFPELDVLRSLPASNVADR